MYVTVSFWKNGDTDSEVQFQSQQGVADKALFVPYFSSWESLLWLDHFFKGHMGARLGGQHTIQHGY